LKTRRFLLDTNYPRYINTVFEKYLLEGTTYPWMVSENGELLADAEHGINISQGDLDRVAASIDNESQGWFVHSIEIDSVPAKVVSIYYPVRFIKRDLVLVFSMKTDIFLKNNLVKIVIITICSLLLLALLLYLNFWVIRKRIETFKSGRIADVSLSRAVDALPLGIILADPGGKIRMMNLASRELLFKDPAAADPEPDITDLGFESMPETTDHVFYSRFLGQGEVVSVNSGKGKVYLFKREWTFQTGSSDTLILMLIDISTLERSRNLDHVAKRARNDLMTSMQHEIDVPVDHIQKDISNLAGLKPGPAQKECLESLQKSHDLLANLGKVFAEFASQDANKVVLEEIPFSLNTEIDMALEPYKAIAGSSNSSIITKIRSEVPDRVVGDPFRLRKLISSLVELSLDLTMDGRILVSAEILEQIADHVKIQFQVEDTGSGMDAEQVEKYMALPADAGENLPDDLEKMVLMLTVARQHAELMKGQLWFESPSSISTDPSNPGIKFSFTIEVKPESLSELRFSGIEKYSDINCLILTQQKDSPEAGQFKLLGDMGLNLKYLIYRPDNMESLIELVREKLSEMQMLLFVDSKEENGFGLAGRLIESGIGQDIIKMLFSSKASDGNGELSMKLGIDYFFEGSFESNSLYEIISLHFPGIPLQDARRVPRGKIIDPSLAILLAEDNLFNRKVAQALFKSIGLEIDLATNGREVLEMLEQKKYDIIFMDLLMPEMDGLETTAAVRKGGNNIPIIALTAVEDEKTRQSAEKAGITDYLVKPATADKIKEILLQSFSKSL